jgi:hypothetical protein
MKNLEIGIELDQKLSGTDSTMAPRADSARVPSEGVAFWRDARGIFVCRDTVLVIDLVQQIAYGSRGHNNEEKTDYCQEGETHETEKKGTVEETSCSNSSHGWRRH